MNIQDLFPLGLTGLISLQSTYTQVLFASKPYSTRWSAISWVCGYREAMNMRMLEYGGALDKEDWLYKLYSSFPLWGGSYPYPWHCSKVSCVQCRIIFVIMLYIRALDLSFLCVITATFNFLKRSHRRWWIFYRSEVLSPVSMLWCVTHQFT